MKNHNTYWKIIYSIAGLVVGLLPAILISSMMKNMLKPLYSLNDVSSNQDTMIYTIAALGAVIGLVIGFVAGNSKDKRLSAIEDKRQKQLIDSYFGYQAQFPYENRDYRDAIKRCEIEIHSQWEYILQWISAIESDTYSVALEVLKEQSIETSYLVLKGLLTLPQCIQSVKKSRRHAVAFENKYNKMASTLSESNDIGAEILNLRREANKYKGIYNDVVNDIPLEISIAMNPHEAYDLSVYANKNDEFITDIKKTLLFLAIQEPFDAEMFQTMLNTYRKIFLTKASNDRGKEQFIPTTDYIIAQSFNYSKGGLIDSINAELNNWLKYYNTSTFSKQYEILLNVFKYLKARKQEEMVLEHIFLNNIARTQEHEQRLSFLKKGINDAPPIINADVAPDIISYDYRSINWDKKEIESYFDTLTMSQKVLEHALVMEEIVVGITVSDVVWDINKPFSIFAEGIKKAFDNKLSCQLVESGAITQIGITPEKSILIKSKDGSCPWWGLLIRGEQQIKKSINIYIYTLFFPVKKAELQNVAQINNQYYSETIVLKQKQNPQINGMIENVKNISGDLLKEWYDKCDVLEDEYQHMYD